MCWIFKKKVYPQNAKYKKGDYVNFRYRGDLYFGYINDASLNDNGQVVYVIQIAGQCPAFIKDYNESDIIGLKTN